jgi:hypothetical protein
MPCAPGMAVRLSRASWATERRVGAAAVCQSGPRPDGLKIDCGSGTPPIRGAGRGRVPSGRVFLGVETGEIGSPAAEISPRRRTAGSMLEWSSSAERGNSGATAYKNFSMT